MSCNRSYRCEIHWKHRKWGPQHERLVSEGTSIRRAIAHALLSFFSGSNKSQRENHRDAHAEIQISARRLPRKAAP